MFRSRSRQAGSVARQAAWRAQTMLVLHPPGASILTGHPRLEPDVLVAGAVTHSGEVADAVRDLAAALTLDHEAAPLLVETTAALRRLGDMRDSWVAHCARRRPHTTPESAQISWEWPHLDTVASWDGADQARGEVATLTELLPRLHHTLVAICGADAAAPVGG